MDANAYKKGKAVAGQTGALDRAKYFLETGQARRHPDLWSFCWGTIMATAQAIDPTVNHRSAARKALGWTTPLAR